MMSAISELKDNEYLEIFALASNPFNDTFGRLALQKSVPGKSYSIEDVNIVAYDDYDRIPEERPLYVRFCFIMFF